MKENRWCICCGCVVVYKYKERKYAFCNDCVSCFGDKIIEFDGHKYFLPDICLNRIMEAIINA